MLPVPVRHGTFCLKTGGKALSSRIHSIHKSGSLTLLMKRVFPSAQSTSSPRPDAFVKSSSITNSASAVGRQGVTRKNSRCQPVPEAFSLSSSRASPRPSPTFSPQPWHLGQCGLPRGCCSSVFRVPTPLTPCMAKCLFAFSPAATTSCQAKNQSRGAWCIVFACAVCSADMHHPGKNHLHSLTGFCSMCSGVETGRCDGAFASLRVPMRCSLWACGLPVLCGPGSATLLPALRGLWFTSPCCPS